MSGKRTKLKKINLTSVDMVRRGANQEAYINLYKSAGDPENPSAPPGTPGSPEQGEIPQGLWKSIVDAVKSFLGTGEAEEGNPAGPEGVEKAADTFSDKIAQQEIRDNRWKFQDALNCSIDSILNDNELSEEEKVEMMNTSVEQFAAAYKEMCAKLAKTTANKTATETPATAVGKTQEVNPDNNEEGEEDMKIDKSRFSPEELAQYEALLAKGRVEDDDDQDDKEDKFPKKKEEKEVEKSAEMHPEVKKALEEMQNLQKSMEMKEMTDIAKKYALLGKKEDELAKTLYDMKKSSPESYNAYVEVLDQSLALVNKSGQFEEIGKSGSYTSVAKSEPEARIDGIAKSYMEKDPTMDYNTALMKAWENNPDLVDAYERTY